MAIKPGSSDSSSSHTLTLACPAKVNLALSVASPRPDGLHPLASWMVALDFSDTLTLTRGQASISPTASRLEIHYAVDAPLPGKVDWPVEKDLAWRAQLLLQEHVGRPLVVNATLAKRIPTGAGLGGGSSDAAAMLVGLNRLFALNLPAVELCQLASQLGSDVTFLTAAMLGNPSALVTGVGHDISPLPLEKMIHLVLIFPGVACHTGQVYQAFDEHLTGSAQQADVSRVRQLASQPLTPDGPFNDLADGACRVQPMLQTWLEKVATLLGQAVHVTGSGATLYTLTADAASSQQMARKITDYLGLPTLATHTLAS